MLIADLHEQLRLQVLATVRSRQITQRALAELIGVRQTHISNFLRGRRGLSIEAMDAMLKVLGLDVMNLLESDKPSPTDSATLEGVPLIDYRAALNPQFANNEILGELKYSTVLLKRVKAHHSDKRTDWVRFIAIRADAALAAPMHPRLSNGSVLLVDRHSCSMAGKNQTHLYLICKEQTLMVRWAEMQSSNLSLRPDSFEYPMGFISINKSNPITSCIVGRVIYITTDLDRPVLGRPLLL